MFVISEIKPPVFRATGKVEITSRNNSASPDDPSHKVVAELESDPALNFQSEVSREILEIWRARAGDGMLPSRRDFDPVEIPRHLLPHMFMVDVLHESAAARFRYRLLGTYLTDMFGRDSTGLYLDKIYPPGFYRDIRASLEEAIARKSPLRVVGRSNFVNKEWLTFEGAYLPLSEDGETINIVLGTLTAV